MKRFLIRLLSFFILFVALDFSAGKFFAFAYVNSKGGNSWRNNYICNHTSEDVLIFGSSRALHHYNPKIIEKELGLSCYNCGQDGNGIILNLGRLMLITSRYNPKLIIYDITPSFDVFAKDDNHKYLYWLRPFYDHPPIHKLFEKIDSVECYKMLCHLYRNNSSFLMALADWLHPQKSIGTNGYQPLNGMIDISKTIDSASAHYRIDSLKMTMMDQFIQWVDSSTYIVFVYSPMWSGRNSNNGIKQIKELCSRNGVPFLDYSNSDVYVHNNECFVDGSHLNSNGADLFTEELIRSLKLVIFPL